MLQELRSLGFVALFIGAASIVASIPPQAQASPWTVRSEWSSAGTPYCYAQAQLAPGARMTLAHTAAELIVVLRINAWRLTDGPVRATLVVDTLGGRTATGELRDGALVVRFTADDPLGAALGAGDELRVTLDDGPTALLPLHGSAAGLASLQRCHREHAASHAAEQDAWTDPLTAAATAEPLDAGRAAGLARAFQTWLAATAPSLEPRVQASGDGGPFHLTTTIGDGSIRLLAGTSHADVLADGATRLRGLCAAGGRVVEHDRYDLNGLIAQRARVDCFDTGRALEAVTISFCDDPGGLSIALEDDRTAPARWLMARVVEDLAAREGFALELDEPALGS